MLKYTQKLAEDLGGLTCMSVVIYTALAWISIWIWGVAAGKHIGKQSRMEISGAKAMVASYISSNQKYLWAFCYCSFSAVVDLLI